MNLFVSLNEIPVVHGAITIPFSGCWYADLVISEPKPVTGLLTLVLSGETYKCTAVRAVNFAGARGVRVVGGAGGWRRVLPPRQYANGVQLSTVLRDAASAVGEQINVAKDRQIGFQYLRPQGVAANVLNDLQGKAWWMDPLGVVQTGARSKSPIVSEFTAIHVAGAEGKYLIATEAVGDWTPGRSFAGPTVSGIVSRVEHLVTKGQLRTQVLSE